MRKITKEACANFSMHTPYKNANTEVKVFGETAEMYLHGNLIARHILGDGLYVTNAGWQTNTTKERLNGLKGVSISQAGWVWYLNGKEWDGKMTKI